MAGDSEVNGGVQAEEYHQKALSGVGHAFPSRHQMIICAIASDENEIKND